jgi:prepilin-type processing-associated H-X9-DG protein
MDDEIAEEDFVEEARGSSRQASTALFAGVIALISSVAVVGGLIGVAAVVLAVRALRQIRQSGGRLHGKGMAIAGMTLGLLAIPAALLALGLYLLYPVLLRYRHEAEIAGTEDRMRLILSACAVYAADDNDFLPPSLAPVVTLYSLPTKALRDVRDPALPMAQPPVDTDYGKYEAEIAAHLDFTYTGDDLRLTMKGPGRVMVLFANWPAMGRRLVGFADGHVERVPANEWAEVIAATNEARVARHRAPLAENILALP